MSDAPATPGKTFRDWVQFAIVVLVAFWGAYTFIYKEVIVPNRRPATLLVTPSLAEIGRRDGFSLVRARLELKNGGEKRVYAPAITYVVYGFRFATQNLSDSALVELEKRLLALPPERRSPMQISSRHSKRDRATVLVSWIEPDKDVWLDPGLTETFEHMFLVPHDVYDALRLDVQYYMTKRNKRIARVDWEAMPDGTLEPSIYLKRWDTDTVRKKARLYDFADTIESHRNWKEENGFQTSLSTVSLGMWPATRP
jgi:hypothetical protein